MAPETRRMSFPKVVVEKDTDSEQSSEEEEYEEEEDDQNEYDEDEMDLEKVDKNSNVYDSINNRSIGNGMVEKEEKKRVPIVISLGKVCKVCKGKGHEAGFKGATYIDCPMKPCFLCKKPGHTTMTCPHRFPTEHGVVPRHSITQNSLQYVFERQLRTHVPLIKPAFTVPDQVNCAVIRYHSRRVTCLEFHPTSNNILLSGDKKGQLGIWDYVKVHEKTVYGNIHTCILNNMKFNPTDNESVYAASSDGTISYTDLETGISLSLLNLNPDGWQGPSKWRMLYGLDVNSEKGLALVADNFGFLYMVDARCNNKVGETVLIHKKGSKVVGLHCNPCHPDLLLSCGNDHYARIWDLRRLESGSSLCSLRHGRVVNSAYFSPQTGSKILTTSQDNRLRVWDSIHGNLESPSREIVHSHDFNRYLTPFRAEWDPKDTSESLVVIGRYISENYNGAALHPIDFIDISTGKLVSEVIDPNITTITPVNKLHPRDDILASGSARSLFIWRPKEESEEVVQHKDEKKFIICEEDEKKYKKKKFHGESDDSDNDVSTLKGKKNPKSYVLKQKDFKSRKSSGVKRKS